MTIATFMIPDQLKIAHNIVVITCGTARQTPWLAPRSAPGGRASAAAGVVPGRGPYR
jgi:hypothetical protein